MLGPLAVEVGGRAVALGGPRRRAVLVRLVVARGEPVSVDAWRFESLLGEARRALTAVRAT
ncbi:hypothetical protein FraQA3DRAFT_1926 [Frankia sp. QA3]|nr:hypothetical protein FraQA3DRAFT_1926 [Frankia sp. QA3]